MGLRDEAWEREGFFPPAAEQAYVVSLQVRTRMVVRCHRVRRVREVKGYLGAVHRQAQTMCSATFNSGMLHFSAEPITRRLDPKGRALTSQEIHPCPRCDEAVS